MIVVKFSGVALSSAESVGRICEIVDRHSQNDSLVVVVSAVSGITDRLIAAARQALVGGEWSDTWLAMRDEHIALAESVVPKDVIEQVSADINNMFGQLHSIYLGVEYVGDLSRKTLDTVVSYG